MATKKKPILPKAPEKNMGLNFYQKGRGAQIITGNRFQKLQYSRQYFEAIDDWDNAVSKTEFLPSLAKTLVNKVASPDVGMEYSMNAYAGCEHGCIYCYARNSHEYLGYNASVDFEQKILVKHNAAELLKKFLEKPGWDAAPLTMSGNTDCYQPAEQKFALTRQLLQICANYNQPVSIITKNVLVQRDLDILVPMAAKQQVAVLFSITSLQEELRRVMEPRTASWMQKLSTMQKLAKVGIRTGVMLGPMIPGLNDHEIHNIMQSAADAGASFAAYTFIRLNGAVGFVFQDWLYKNFPNKAPKIWKMIEESHGGQVNDSRFGLRMRGEGQHAELIRQQFKKYQIRYGLSGENWTHNRSLFKVPNTQLRLF